MYLLYDLLLALALLVSAPYWLARLLGQGKSNKQITYVLTIGEKTVETHRGRLMLKLGVSSLGDLIRYAIRNGVVEL